jgi:hypothetical protein
MEFLRLIRSKLIVGMSIACSLSIAIFGGLTFVHENSFSNRFWGILGILYMPGLAIAALLGGKIHDPSFVLAGILNFAIYSVGLIFILNRLFRPRARPVPSAK